MRSLALILLSLPLFICDHWTNFEQFVNEAQTWNNDYHLGVTTMDLDADGGRLVGSPRFVEPTTPDAVNMFKNNVQVGTNGSGTEQGLAAAQVAVTLPYAADSTKPCVTAADCVEVGEGEEPPADTIEGCYDGFCGGPNRGFLRKEASLELVFLSDEEDQSAPELDFYKDLFYDLKGNLLHVHAIVGPQGGCSSSNGDAVAHFGPNAVGK